jgi:two-component system sensor histidine kinase ChvG
MGSRDPVSSRAAPASVDRVSRRWSLRLRVIAAIILVALAPQIVVFVWTQIDRPVPGRLWGRARDATDDAQNALARLPVDEAAPELARIAQQRGVRLRVFGEDGEVLFDADSDNPREPFNRVEAFFLGASGATLSEIDDEAGPVLLRPGVAEAKRTGWFIACQYISAVYCESIRPLTDEAGKERIVYAQTTSRRAVWAVYELRRQLLRLGLITVPLSLVLAFYLGGRLVRPLERLQRQALEQASAAGPTATLDPERRDEVGALADAFNTLLRALDRKRVENEAFVADLVHEMKNPVAAVRACADALKSGGADPARSERLARVLTESSANLDRLVTHFLELARAEAGMPNEERTAVDVGALVRALVTSMRDDVRHAGVTFVLDASTDNDDCRILGVAHRLDALARELLENAASFAGEGGKVTARVARHQGNVLLTVTDDGPGIAAEDVPRVFDRFFTTRGERRGTGLGLALVQAVARAHGGDVTARSRPQEGTTLEVRLPRAE